MIDCFCHSFLIASARSDRIVGRKQGSPSVAGRVFTEVLNELELTVCASCRQEVSLLDTIFGIKAAKGSV